MKKHAFLAVSSVLLVSVGLWVGQLARNAWSAPSDGAAPDDAAAEYALAAEGAEVDKGTILFEYYWGTDGTISSLESLPTFPNYPDDREWRASLEGPTDWRDHYGTYVRGYLYPPGTGNYTFWIASDDQSQLWLSKDESPGHAVQIASVLVWTPARDFDNTGGGFGGPQQKSSPIPLTAGKRYYIEVLHAEGIGGDNLAVAWQGPRIRDRSIITSEYLSPITGPQDVIDPNLIGWWKMEEGSGTIVQDSSGHDKHGTIYNYTGGLGLNGAVWVSDPERGTVLSFDGNDAAGAYVDAGTIPAMDLAGGFTWTFWARQDAAQSTAIPGGGNDVMLGNRFGGTETPLQFVKFTPTKFEYFNDYDLMAIDYQDLPGGHWVHHAVVKKGATLTYYRDGVQAGTRTLTKTMDENPFFMGGDTGGERWRGWLSDVRIYDRGLSAAEIRALVNAVRGEYFTNMTLSGNPALIRLDPQIHFNWAGEVFPGTSDQCSVRWTGEVEAAFTEPYTFHVNTDDGARLWLNGNLIIDAWWDQGATEHAGQPIQLVAGQKYPIRLEWYDNTLSATCELRWSSPSTPKQVIPSAKLHPPEPSTGGGTSTGSSSMTLNPTSGPVGTVIAITGSGFAANTSGNLISPWVSKLLTTTPDGTFSTTVTVPEKTPGGDYPFAADFPLGGPEEASATFTVTPARITVNPTSGPPGTTITITGSSFLPDTEVEVVLWPHLANLRTSPTGTFSTTMDVPSLTAGNEKVQASDGHNGASASFTVTTSGPTPSIVVWPTSGAPGTSIWLSGSGFAPGTSGKVALGCHDWMFTMPQEGSFWVLTKVPWLPSGDYMVQADFPSGGSIEASASFTITTWGPATSIVISPTSGPPGTTITVTGSGFEPGASGYLTFGGLGAPKSVTISSDGTFSTTMDVPSPLSARNLPVQAGIQWDGCVYASATFTVTPHITVSPTSGHYPQTITITGSGFAASISGNVTLGSASQPVTTSSDGTFSTTLAVPLMKVGPHAVQADIPSGGSVEASATFVVN